MSQEKVGESGILAVCSYPWKPECNEEQGWAVIIQQNGASIVKYHQSKLLEMSEVDHETSFGTLI